MSQDATRNYFCDHARLSRRWLLKMGAIGTAAMCLPTRTQADDETHSTLEEALEGLESYFTRQDDFQDVSRGRPKPHSIDDETRQAVGLTRESWTLEVISDSEHPTRMSNPLTKERGTEFNFDQLMEIAKTDAVRFPKVMTCLNIGCPLGMGIWEGVPLRNVIWRAEPTENLRRVFYDGYHNEDPKQLFRSSLPIGRVLEDPFDLPPVILCYKLNDDWLTPERGGPVRIVVPEAYGFKSIKWLKRLYLSNIAHANDTYAEQNNDVDSPLKTFAATLTVPSTAPANKPFAITGYAQSGIAGLERVQVWFQNRDEEWPSEDRYFQSAPWVDATLLGPPSDWGGEFSSKALPTPLHGFREDPIAPKQWPMRLSKAHWGFLHQGLEPGRYFLRSRTIDGNGNAQPMPRPFRKSGHAAIERVAFVVE